MSAAVVEAWAAPVPPGVSFPRFFLEILGDAEGERCRRLRSDGARRRFIFGRVLLRLALSSRFGRHPSEWSFTPDGNGKCHLTPITGLPAVDFSISHSENAVAVAVSDSCRAGVDVECLDPRLVENSVEAVFTGTELVCLAGLPQEKRWRETLRLWTAKEAYAKLLGLGFHVDFTSFEVSMDPPRVTGPLTEGAHLETREIDLGGATYQLSVAARGPGGVMPKIAVRSVDLLSPSLRGPGGAAAIPS